MYRIAIDVGGTFTDCLVLDADGGLQQFKALNTPGEPTRGFFDCLEKAAKTVAMSVREFVGAISLVIHGTTLATNALLTGRGAKVGMLTTEGFRDELECRRGFKNIHTSMYNLSVPPYRPLVRRHLRLPVRERTIQTGEVKTPVAAASVQAALDHFEAEKVQAVAICFLHSYANHENEQTAAALCQERFDGRVYVTCSHEILPVSGEFERFSTTVVSAYLGPIVSQYFATLEQRLSEMGFKGSLLTVRSDGLVQSADHSRRQAVTVLNSGPAAAPIAAAFFGGLLGHDNLISVDMGGTSLDVCLIWNGQIPTALRELALRRGLLRVGPQSASSDPGPACYGRGGNNPTVTDADVLLGYIPADHFLGGQIKLDAARARQAMEKVAKPLQMTEAQAAQATFKVVNSLMADQVIEQSTKRGYDVRDFAMVVGGGAGPVHAAHIAELLGIPTVLIPKYAATYSAFGSFAMDIGREYSQSYVVRADKVDFARLESLFGQLTKKAQTDLAESAVQGSDLIWKRTAQMRYAGQFFEIEVPLEHALNSADDVVPVLRTFHAKHKELYGFQLPQRSVEFRTLSLRATISRTHALKTPPLARGKADPKAALKRTRRCLFGEDWVDTPCYDGSALLAGNVIAGPAIIEEEATTVVVPETFTCRVDDSRTYVLTRR